jgi:hypothetical protein
MDSAEAQSCCEETAKAATPRKIPQGIQSDDQFAEWHECQCTRRLKIRFQAWGVMGGDDLQFEPVGIDEVRAPNT